MQRRQFLKSAAAASAVSLLPEKLFAEAAKTSAAPDLVLLDIMLPKKDGQQVLSEIRKESTKPVIMVSAKGEVFDKVLLPTFGKPTIPNFMM